MNIGNGMKVNVNVNVNSTIEAKGTKAKLAIGHKVNTQAEKAAEISLSDKAKQQNIDKIGQEAIQENIMSMTCDINDIVMADEMIRAANRRILENAEESMIAQSEQSAEATMELLK